MGPHDCLLTSCTGVVLPVVKRSSYSRSIGLSGLCTFSAPLYSPLRLSRALQTRLRHRFPRQVVGTVTNARESLRFAPPALSSRLLSFHCPCLMYFLSVRETSSMVGCFRQLSVVLDFVDGQAKLVLIRKGSSRLCSGSSVK